MRTILFLIGLFIININLTLSSTPTKSEWDKIKTNEDLRVVRFSKFPLKSYKEDNDMEVYGNSVYLYKQTNLKKEIIQQKIKLSKQQNSKFKSTYLDFTILQEENIS